jgi:CheY-like chemotaxis protein
MRAMRCRPASQPGHPVELLEGDAISISVRDTGSGIPADILERVVEPFFTTKAAGKGTGLGLAMVHGFAIQSRGALRIESRVGEGTTITLFLPRGSAKDAGDHTIPALVTHEMLAGETLLLVDDDDTLRFVTAAELRDSGCRVIDANGAEQALDIVAHGGIDIAILDVMMPGVDGPTLARRLRAIRPDLPILFMTARPDYAGLEGEKVITKPATACDIINNAALMLEAHDSRAAAARRYDRLAKHIKSGYARSLFADWRASQKGDFVPDFNAFELGSCPEAHKLSIVTVDATRLPMEFQVAALAEPSRATVSDAAGRLDVPGSDQVGAPDVAYRRCQRSAQPVHELSPMDRIEDEVATLERLLLPYSTDGQTVTHIVAAITVAPGLASSAS